MENNKELTKHDHRARSPLQNANTFLKKDMELNAFSEKLTVVNAVPILFALDPCRKSRQLPQRPQEALRLSCVATAPSSQERRPEVYTF